MNKLFLLSLLSLLYFASSQLSCYDLTQVPKKAENCYERKVEQTSGTKCCFFKANYIFLFLINL